MFSNKKGFTIMEIMTVVFIIGLLAAAIYIGTTPYYQRSRDAGRLTQVQSYASVFSTYKQSADVFPSNTGSGPAGLGTGSCISEIFSRPDYSTVDMKFTSLSKGVSNPPLDPLGDSAIPVQGCPIRGSYYYRRLINPSSLEQIAIVASRLEAMGSANLATGTFIVPANMDYLYNNTKRGTVGPESPDAIFFMALK